MGERYCFERIAVIACDGWADERRGGCFGRECALYDLPRTLCASGSAYGIGSTPVTSPQMR
jgi:hypothetical protein